MIAPTELKKQTQECQLSGQSYIWQLVPQSLNPKSGMTLIIGNSGSGKTFWFQQLQKSLPSTESITCQRNINLMGLIKQFIHLYGAHAPLGPLSIEAQAQAVLASLPEGQEDRYLLIDDANWLTREALTWLLYIAEHYEQHRIAILLFAPPLLQQRITSINQDLKCIHIHEILLRPLESSEIQSFIERTYLTHYPLAPAVLRRIHQASGGNPREVMKLVQDHWTTLHPEPAAEGTNEPQDIDTPSEVAHTNHITPKRSLRLMVSFLALCLIVTLLLLRSPKHQSPETSLRIETPSETEPEAPPEDVKPSEPPEEAPLPIPVLTVDLEEDTEPLPTPTPQEEAKVPWYKAPGYLVQLALMPKKNKRILDNMAETYAQIAPTHILCVVRKGSPLCLLLLGPFTERSAARTALARIPKDVATQNHAWIRTTESLEREELDVT